MASRLRVTICSCNCDLRLGLGLISNRIRVRVRVRVRAGWLSPGLISNPDVNWCERGQCGMTEGSFSGVGLIGVTEESDWGLKND